MSKLKFMMTHYIIMGGTMTKLSEVCIATGDVDNVEGMEDCFVRRVNKDMKLLKENPDNVDVIKMNVTGSITNVTVSGLNGTHVLEYYITLVSD